MEKGRRTGVGPIVPGVSRRRSLGWDQGHSWDALNAQLPVGPTSSDNSSKNITLSVTNNTTMNGPDPQSDAAIVGVHLTGRPTTYRGFSSARSSEVPNFWRFL
jgi:hypothetical protein